METTNTASSKKNAQPPLDSNFDFVTGDVYAPAPEATSHVKIAEKYELFIDGKFVAPRSGKYFEATNPATGEMLSQIAEGSEEDVDLAVKAARKAYTGVWGKMSGRERGKYIFRIARLLQERAREFAIIESLDGGKPITESRDVDVPLAAAHFFYYAGWADKLNYAFAGATPKSIGVAGQIIPWNFPLLMAAWKIAPALATGNTVVIKPAETTSLTMLKLAELFSDAGLPDGVVNVVTGAGKTGSYVVNHKDVDKVAFTGSTAVGKMIMKSVAGTGKKYTLELGGKSANIVFEDAPLDQAVEGIITSIFFNQGQVCCAGSRLFVQEGIADRLITKLKARMDQLIIGDPLDKNTDVGAINSKMQLDKITSLCKVGLDEGCEMYQAKCTLPTKGHWFKPTIFTNVSQSSRIANEEIFGPVLAIQTFRHVDEVVSKANNSPYGLAAGVWTDKGSKIFNVSSKMKAGIVWGNCYNKFDPTSPFGGFKESGVGREGGLHGLLPYLKLN